MIPFVQLVRLMSISGMYDNICFAGPSDSGHMVKDFDKVTFFPLFGDRESMMKRAPEALSGSIKSIPMSVVDMICKMLELLPVYHRVWRSLKMIISIPWVVGLNGLAKTSNCKVVLMSPILPGIDPFERSTGVISAVRTKLNDISNDWLTIIFQKLTGFKLHDCNMPFIVGLQHYDIVYCVPRCLCVDNDVIQHVVCGSLNTLTAVDNDVKLDDDLNKILKEFYMSNKLNGKPIILFTLGSVPVKNLMEIADIVYDVCKQNNAALLFNCYAIHENIRQCERWCIKDGVVTPTLISDDCLVVRKLNYPDVFPHIYFMINHGGIGSVIVSLLRGVPNLCYAVFCDQFVTGKMVQSKS